MEKSKVYFTNLRARGDGGLLAKLERMLKRAGLEQIDFNNQFTAIKMHFGEPGNLAYIRPNYIAKIVSMLQHHGTRLQPHIRPRSSGNHC